MFAEDMTAFFSGSEFAVTATFTPAVGAPVSANVIFNAATQSDFSDSVLSDEYTMVYPTGALPGVKSGDYGTVDGVRYRVRDMRLKTDGKLTVTKLSKAP